MSTYRKKFGAWGEDIAVRYLIGQNCEILMRNYRAGRGEIDIIAREGNEIVFVEVKTGNSRDFGPPEQNITPAKQRQLYKVAEHFIAENPDPEAEYRFDAIIIDGSRERYEIRHYRNAFYF